MIRSRENVILQARRASGPGMSIYYADLMRWPTEQEKDDAQKVMQRLHRIRQLGV